MLVLIDASGSMSTVRTDGTTRFDAAKARAALTPLRRELLERLHEPGSASSLAGQLDLPRQKLAYHLRVLEEAGLVKLVEERPRRGFVGVSGAKGG